MCVINSYCRLRAAGSICWTHYSEARVWSRPSRYRFR